MNSSLLLSVATFTYGLAAFIYLVAWVFRKDQLNLKAFWTVVGALVFNIAGFSLRWVESYQMGIGHAPLSNLYESLIFFALMIASLFLFIEKKYGFSIIGVSAIPLAFLAMAYASLSPDISDRIQPLLPALKSNWLIAHVITCFIGYASFAMAFGLSLMYLIRPKDSNQSGKLISKIPDTKVIDELTYQMVMFGFIFLSAGIITGAVWANSAWGRYWGWDPKEIWSLITWLVYATLLHARFMRGWRGKRVAVFSIIGFAMVLFTYFGVNLLPGLHSYGA